MDHALVNLLGGHVYVYTFGCKRVYGVKPLADLRERGLRQTTGVRVRRVLGDVLPQPVAVQVAGHLSRLPVIPDDGRAGCRIQGVCDGHEDAPAGSERLTAGIWIIVGGARVR